ncbi:MAG: Gfo/Idh/MocA family protein [Succinivibrio sp.]
MLNFAVLGAGVIADTMATTINLMKKKGIECVKLYAVASRDLKKASDFASKFNVEKAYGSYDDMLNDRNVDLVYVATPHNFHYEQAKKCLEAGKHVLLEKAFTVNAKQAEELFELAKEKKLLITEAIWTRYQPMREIINNEIAKGTIGRVSMLTANLSYSMATKERLVKPELAGGALLDVGIYPLNFANMILGDPDDVDAVCIKNSLGVDMSDSITLRYNSTGQMAVLCASALDVSDRFGIIHGSKGFMVVDNVNNPLNLKVYSADYTLIKSIDAPEQLTGYEYEVIETADAIEKGKLECDSMPHERTLYMMRLMDSIRAQLGIRYPFEN